MNLNQLHYFVVLSKNLNYRRTAEILNITQPTLSQSIMNLEKELGIKLFIREGHNISLTEYGNLYLMGVEPILNELNILNTEITELSSLNGGHIDIGYVAPLALDFIPRNTRKFLNNPEHEKISFTFHEESTVMLIKALRESRYNVIFAPEPKDRNGLIVTPLLKQRIVVIVPKNHRLSEKKIINLSELKGERFISYHPTSALRVHIDKMIEKSGFMIEPIEASNESGIIALVENGFGVACITDVGFDESKVSVLEIKDADAERTIYMISKSNELSSATKEYIKFMIKESEGNEHIQKIIR